MKRAGLMILLGTMATGLLVGNDQPPMRRDILGVHLKMTEAEVRNRLTEVGTFMREERKRQEIWTTRDETFSHLIIGFDKERHLRFVTAVARVDGQAKRMRYEEAGALLDAKQAGDPKINNFNYVWSVPEKDGVPGMEVIARGRDPAFLDTYSFKRTETAPAGEEKDDE